MTVSYPSALCAEVEGLLCLSDLTDLEVQQPLCSSDDPCLHFFDGIGFRPAAWAVERDQYGDHMILIVSGDNVYYAKFDMPFDAMAFLPLEGALPLPGPAVSTPVLLATPGGAPAGLSFGGFSGFPGISGFGGGGGSGTRPVIPGRPDGTPPPGSSGQTAGGGREPTLLAPVPLSGSGLFLILALVAMIVTVARRRWSGRVSAGN